MCLKTKHPLKAVQVCQSYINGQMEWWFHFLFTVSDGQPGFNWGWVRFSLILFRHDAGTCYLSASTTCLPSIELAKLWYLSMYGRTIILLWICLPIFGPFLPFVGPFYHGKSQDLTVRSTLTVSFTVRYITTSTKILLAHSFLCDAKGILFPGFGTCWSWEARLAMQRVYFLKAMTKTSLILMIIITVSVHCREVVHPRWPRDFPRPEWCSEGHLESRRKSWGWRGFTTQFILTWDRVRPFAHH